MISPRPPVKSAKPATRSVRQRLPTKRHNSSLKLAAWNVNSLKVRLPQLLDWLGREQPDAVCLQETKVEDRNFPIQEIERSGYRAVFSGQKTYNGVAILAREIATAGRPRNRWLRRCAEARDLGNGK